MGVSQMCSRPPRPQEPRRLAEEGPPRLGAFDVHQAEEDGDVGEGVVDELRAGRVPHQEDGVEGALPAALLDLGGLLVHAHDPAGVGAGDNALAAAAQVEDEAGRLERRHPDLRAGGGEVGVSHKFYSDSRRRAAASLFVSASCLTCIAM